MNNMTARSPAPTEQRIASLDVIRGVAVFGILSLNILWFGMPHAAAYDPTVYGGAEGVNLWAWFIPFLLVEGTQRGLFSLLFGASAVLFTARLEAAQHPHASDLYFRRNLWMVVFGLVHGFLFLWVADILFMYGVLALFIYAFRKAAPKTLLLLGLGGFIVNAAWNQLDAYQGAQAHAAWQTAIVAQQAGKALTHEQQQAVAAWKELVAVYKPDADFIRRDIEGRHKPYFEQVAFQAPIRNELQAGTYRHFFDVFSMMLVGMALFKSGMFRLGRPRHLYWRMLVLGYGVGLSINFLKLRYLMATDFSALAQLRAGVVYDFGRLAMTIGHVGLLMLWCNSTMLGRLRRRFAAVGQMALTNYVSHSIICAFIFFGVGFGLFGQLQRYQLYYVVFAICAFQLLMSPIWLKYFRFGPLEWLWRSLTYSERQPMRRRGGSTVPAAQGT